MNSVIIKTVRAAMTRWPVSLAEPMFPRMFMGKNIQPYPKTADMAIRYPAMRKDFLDEADLITPRPKANNNGLYKTLNIFQSEAVGAPMAESSLGAWSR